jgi:hypothetical protein
VRRFSSRPSEAKEEEEAYDRTPHDDDAGIAKGSAKSVALLELDSVLGAVLPPTPAEQSGRNGGHDGHRQPDRRAQRDRRRRSRSGDDALAP